VLNSSEFNTTKLPRRIFIDESETDALQPLRH
jgi:hypothetical protein